MSSFYSADELQEIGFNFIGKDVFVSRKTSIYGAENISIGNHVRIDDFCILSGNIKIGDYVHVAAYVCMFGGNTGIELADFVGVSSRTAIYAESDDYSGEVLTNPMVPVEYKHIIAGKVTLGQHVVVGTGSTILPGVSVGEGASVGAMSLINKDILPWTINAGIPCRKIKERSRKLLDYAKEMLNEDVE